MVEYAHPGIGPLNDEWPVQPTVRQFVGDSSHGLESNLAGTVA
ncbi:hypothetical protein [Halorientalis salina]|nr:hypothetical protein [Halorientalis salina]